MSVPTPPTPLPLDYAKTRNNRGLRLLKWFGILTLLIALYFTVKPYAPRAYLFARQYYWQRQCLNFNPPPDTIIYERLPLGSPKPATVAPYMDGTSDEVVALSAWNGHITFHAFAEPSIVVYRTPICWIRFFQAIADTPAHLVAPALLFCHQRISPAGHRRLVAVEYPSMFEVNVGNLLINDMQVEVYAPVGWNGCQPANSPYAEYLWRGSPLPMPRQIFAGQPDPADPSHFTIEYQWPNSVHGFIDGYLLDDDTVTLKIRPGPGDIPSAEKSLAQHPELWPPN